MTGIPLTQKKMENELAALQARVRNLENLRPKRVAAGITRLADLSDVDVEGAEDNEVLTYDGDVEKWVRGYAGPVTPEANEWTASGSFGFGTASYFSHNDSIIAQPLSMHLVIASVIVTNCTTLATVEDYAVSAKYAEIWPVWQLQVYNSTDDPGADDIVCSTGVGNGGAQAAIWVVNDTDTATTPVIDVSSQTISSEDWSADYVLTVRQQYFYCRCGRTGLSF